MHGVCPANSRWGSRNRLGWRDLRGEFRLMPSGLCPLPFPLERVQEHSGVTLVLGAVAPDEILLTRQRSRGAQAGTALPFRCVRVPGIPQIIRQFLTLAPGL